MRLNPQLYKMVKNAKNLENTGIELENGKIILYNINKMIYFLEKDDEC